MPVLLLGVIAQEMKSLKCEQAILKQKQEAIDQVSPLAYISHEIILKASLAEILFQFH